MHPAAERFFALDAPHRRLVQIALCRFAVRAWNQYIAGRGPITYVESVAGTVQHVDADLPAAALNAVIEGVDRPDIARRYLEPITAMQDEDLQFPENIRFGYYAVYNLFEKYVQGGRIDDWLIINQALSVEDDERQRETILMQAVHDASDPGNSPGR